MASARALLMACVAALLIAQSPPPPPAPTKATQEKKGDSRVEDRESTKTTSPTQTLATAVNQATATPTKKTTQNKGTPNSYISTINWRFVNAGLLTLVNVLLVVVGFLQWRSTRKQGGYMRDGLAETKRAADAASASADVAKQAVELAERNTAVTERAVVLIESVVGEPQEGGAWPYLRGSNVIIFTLKNYGATVAYDVKITGEVKCTGKSLGINGAQGVTMAPQGSNQWITASLLTKIPDREINVLNRDGGLTYEIDVTYADAFGKTHQYRAMGQYIPLLRGFITGNSTSD